IVAGGIRAIGIVATLVVRAGLVDFRRRVVDGWIRRHRRRRLGSRDPGPAAAGNAGTVEPAAIVVGRPAPRLVADPGVAVVRFPSPLAVLIGRPGVADAVRDPHLAVLTSGHP